MDTTLRDRATAIGAAVRDRAAQVNERLTVLRYDPPSLSLRSAILIGLAIVIGAVAWSWYVRRERDAWWRARIAQSSAVVEAIAQRGASLATATDAQIIEGLHDADQRYAVAQRQLAEHARQPPKTGRERCRVPAACLAP